MNFKNYEITTIGNANININSEGFLDVFNIGNSGYDGISINNNDKNSPNILFSEITQISNGGTLRISNLGKNIDNQIVTNSELITYFDPVNNKIIWGYNLGLMPEEYTIFGKLNNNIVFEKIKQNPLYNPTTPVVSFWQIVAACVAAGVAVYEALKTTRHRESKIEYYPNGEVKSIYVHEVIDPQEFEIEVDGENYVVNEWGIEYTLNFPEGNDVKLFNDVAVQVTGLNLNSFTIRDLY